jgi:predicted transcriptional regulator
MPRPPLVRGFKSPLHLARNWFGQLERRVVDLVWEAGEASVREVQSRLGDDVAYTTVMTTLDRLYKKGILERRKAGRAFVYSAPAPHAEVERSAVAQLLGGLVAERQGEAQPLLSSLVDALGEADRLLLDELEQLVREKRRQLEGRGRRS